MHRNHGTRYLLSPAYMLLLLLLLGGCAGGGIGQPGSALDKAEPARQGAIRGAGGYSLDVLPETFDGGTQAGAFTLDVQPSGGGAVVRVLGTGLTGLRGFYGRLYCPTDYVVDTAQAGAGLGRPGEVLSLCCGESGVVELGAVQLHCDASAGINGAAELARVVLRRGVSAVRRASSVPARTAASAHCWINCTTKHLEWDARLPGDYNQDGRVAVTDLTPLAVHWGEAPVAFPDSVARYVVDSIQEVVDGNADEALGIGDLTVIGQWAGSQTGGWNLYRSLDPEADFPDVDLDDPLGDGAAPSKIARFAYRTYGALAVADAACERQRFSIDLPLLTDGMAYWVRPVTGGVEGTPSNWSPYDSSLASEVTGAVDPITYTDNSTGEVKFQVWCYGPDTVIGVFRAEGVDQLHVLSVSARFNEAATDYVANPSYDAMIAPHSAVAVLIADNIVEIPGRVLMTVNASLNIDNPALAGDFWAWRLLLHRTPQVMEKAIGVLGYVTMDKFAKHHLSYADPVLSWYYAGKGDYDQDGYVWIGDLLILDYWWGTAGPFAIGSAQYIVDGSSDDMINVCDITTAGIHEGSAISGYNIYATLDPALAPVEDDIPGDPGLAPIGYASFAGAQGDRFVDRLRFSSSIGALASGTYVWVQPEYRGAVGGVMAGDYIQIP